MRWVSAMLLAAGVCLGCPPASAGAGKDVVQRSSLRRVTKQRTQAIYRARKQWVAPHAVARMVAKAARMDVDSRKFRKAIAKIPLQGRLEVFKQKVDAMPQRREAFTALQAFEEAVKARKLTLEQVTAAQKPGNDGMAVATATGDVFRAQREQRDAEDTWNTFQVQSFKRRVSGALYLGNRRNNHQTLLSVVEAGGMAGRGRQLIEAGQVTVNGKVVRRVSVRGEAIRVAGKDKVIVQVSKQLQEWKGLMKQGTTFGGEKAFFEVTKETFDLFAKVMGPNVAWFGGNENPGHLHSLVADQGGRGEMHHNTHGVIFDEGGVSGKYTQYFSPMVLTDHEMDRYVRYQNAGANEGGYHKTKVYGFYARGKKIDDIACTNWATAAPVGALPRWVRNIDKKARGLKGVPAKVRDKGLYRALSEAKDGKARQRLVDKVLSAKGHTKWSYKAVKDLGRRMRRELDDRLAPWVQQLDGMLKKLAREGRIRVPKSVAGDGIYHVLATAKTREARQAVADTVWSEANLPELHERTKRAISKLLQGFNGDDAYTPLLKADFPSRPTDLPLRQSMAKTLGLSRSKDPAMWLTGLMLHPETSIVAVFRGPNAFNAEMNFGLEIMGAIGPSGRMIQNPDAMPAQLKHPNKGSIAVSPSGRCALRAGQQIVSSSSSCVVASETGNE
ncbi:MAG: hypothetical protein JRH20_12635 [Deltaproteobacteria bacterium]|nr:hypothetical protein [Deltaproteobacteria bacterium]